MTLPLVLLSILFPVLTPRPIAGANGTTFATELRVVAPDGTMTLVDEPPIEDADELTYFYELVTTGPDGTRHRATLPVVRESDFRVGPTHLPPLQIKPLPAGGFASRHTIRIYDVDRTGELEVTVRLRPIGTSAYYDRVVSVTEGEGQLSLNDFCVTLPEGNVCRPYAVAVEIIPSRNDLEYYAFATSTNNATGETSVSFLQ